MGRDKTQRNAVLLIVGILVTTATGFSTYYLHKRSHWPASVTNRISELQKAGVPTTLTECDRRYHSLGRTPEALAHFHKIQAGLPDVQLPLMAQRVRAGELYRPKIPDLSPFGSPKEEEKVAACLRRYEAVLPLIHGITNFSRCWFPMEMTNGFRTLMPHLGCCTRAAHLLTLEALEFQKAGKSREAMDSLLVQLHLVKLLLEDPTLLAQIRRDEIMIEACLTVSECLKLGAVPKKDLRRFATNLTNTLAMSEATLPGALANERCFVLDVFQGSNRQIAEFLQQGETRTMLPMAVEMLRVAGILQRDTSFYLDCIGRLESGLKSTDACGLADHLDEVEAWVTKNELLLRTDKKSVNIISCLTLPATVHMVRSHLWARTFCQITLAALAAECYQQETGTRPAALKTLVPNYLPEIPFSPFSGQNAAMRTIPGGFEVWLPEPIPPAGVARKKPGTSETIQEIAFRIQESHKLPK